MKRYKILKIEINNLWCYEFQPHVMGSPLKHGSINLLLDRKPKFKYKQVGNFFFAKDCGLASIYELRKGTTEAFWGAKFDVPMKDGSIYRATGDLWDPFDTTPFSKLLDFNLCRIGYSTPKDYKECPVYCGCYADTKMIMLVFDVYNSKESQ